MQHDVTERVYSKGLTPRVGDLAFYYSPIEHVSIYIGHSRTGVPTVIAATDEQHGVEMLTPDHYLPPIAWGRPSWP
jgi:cell wall-associated NlpC family hydrolase